MLSKLLRFALCLFCLTLVMGCQSQKEKEISPTPTPSTPITALPKPETATLPALTSPLEAASLFFNSVNNEKYDLAWATLTTKSQNKIVNMVAEDEKMDPKAIRELFDQNTLSIQNGFWKSFRASSKIAEIAPMATYKLLSETGPEAITEINSGRIKLELKVYKEGSQWKMGYVETFME